MNRLKVRLDFHGVEYEVGELYLSERLGRYVFNYNRSFLSSGLELSPYAMPLGEQTYTAERNPDMYNLHALFADALPDEWGKRVQDVEFEKIGVFAPSALERLSFIGSYGLGALQFKPRQSFIDGIEAVELADLRKASQRILSGNLEDFVDQLLRAGGSAGGARPKYLVDLKNDGSNRIRYTTGELEEGWIPIILKVAGKNGDHWQRIEFCYFKMAELAGIDVPPTRLLSEDPGTGNAHFAITRFDIDGNGGRYHTRTFAGLLGLDFRKVSLDYSRLFRVVAELCLDKVQVIEAYRRMAFNYLGGNKDDHGKNISFLMDRTGRWFLSPAYDLSYSPGEQGLHAMSVGRKRRNLTLNDFEHIAMSFDIKSWNSIIKEVRESLSRWPEIAAEYGVPRKNIDNIRQRIRENLSRV